MCVRHLQRTSTARSGLSFLVTNEGFTSIFKYLEKSHHQLVSELQRLQSIFGISERQWVEAQVENAKQQVILKTLKSQVSSDEAHINLDLHSLRNIMGQPLASVCLCSTSSVHCSWSIISHSKIFWVWLGLEISYYCHLGKIARGSFFVIIIICQDSLI